jgi:hypothetical protein
MDGCVSGTAGVPRLCSQTVGNLCWVLVLRCRLILQGGK